MGSPTAARRRQLALYVLCLGVLMIVLDTTVVTVALPTIQSHLRFSHAAITWVLNAYTLTFGGFLLLGGRLGDLYGPRRLFLAGLAVFSLASLACGFAHTRVELIVARAAQGFGGAIVSAVSLSLIMNLFTVPAERAVAMGIYGFVAAAGGSIGELVGGLLTQAFGWHAVFLVNLPIGIGVFAACAALLPADAERRDAGSLDTAGAVVITSAMLLAVYGAVHASETGWRSATIAGLLGGAAALLLAFAVLESRTREPLVPLRIFRLRNLATANGVAALFSAGIFVWFVTSALYLQGILRYDPLRVGLAFLPADSITAVFSAGLSARLVMRFGVRRPLVTGLWLCAAGLALFARARIAGSFGWDVLPGMALLGIGSGMAFNPLLLAAMSEVEPRQSGLASGIVNTSFMMGGALGLAAFTSLADLRSSALRHGGLDPIAALNGGYHLAFGLGALLTALAAVLAALVMRPQLATEDATAVSAGS